MKKTIIKKSAKKIIPSKRAKSNIATFSPTTTSDLLISVLILSLLVNLFVVCLWLAVLSTTQYDAELARFLFGR